MQLQAYYAFGPFADFRLFGERATENRYLAIAAVVILMI